MNIRYEKYLPSVELVKSWVNIMRLSQVKSFDFELRLAVKNVVPFTVSLAKLKVRGNSLVSFPNLVKYVGIFSRLCVCSCVRQ